MEHAAIFSIFSIILFFIYSFTVYFFQLLRHNLNLSHSFTKADTETVEAHTKSAKPYTNSPTLTPFSVIKHNIILYVTHKNRRGINIMAKVFANVCFWDVFVVFWMQCLILEKMWDILHFVCAILAKVLKTCKQLKKKSVNVWFCVCLLDISNLLEFANRWFNIKIIKM